MEAKTNNVATIVDMITKIQNLNLGEARKNSKNSFENILKGINPHPKNTSPEEWNPDRASSNIETKNGSEEKIPLTAKTENEPKGDQPDSLPLQEKDPLSAHKEDELVQKEMSEIKDPVAEKEISEKPQTETEDKAATETSQTTNVSKTAESSEEPAMTEAEKQELMTRLTELLSHVRQFLETHQNVLENSNPDQPLPEDFLKDLKELLAPLKELQALLTPETGNQQNQEWLNQLVFNLKEKPEFRDIANFFQENQNLIEKWSEQLSQISESQEQTLTEDDKVLLNALQEILTLNKKPSSNEETIPLETPALAEAVQQLTETMDTKTGTVQSENGEEKNLTKTLEAENPVIREILANKDDIKNQNQNQNPLNQQKEPTPQLPEKETMVKESIEKTDPLQVIKNNPIPKTEPIQETEILKESTKNIVSQNAQVTKDSPIPFTEKGTTQPGRAHEQTQIMKNPEKFQYLSKAFESEREIIDRIITQAQLKLNGAQKEINFNLVPPELGRVRITIQEVNGAINGKIQVENDAIKEIVQTNIEQLKNSLSQTIRVEKIDIEVRENPDRNPQNPLWRDAQGESGDSKNRHYQREKELEERVNQYLSLEIPLPKGVFVHKNGTLTVDLIG